MAGLRHSVSSSSFNSSAPAPRDLTFTPSSAATSQTSAPTTALVPLDLGPPGYNATIKLYERTANETTVFLGPWDVVSAESRRVVWRCSYAGEVLEHFLPSEYAADIFPYTLHSQHRRFGDPREMELYLTFREHHRVRYTTVDGLFHDDYIEVKYEFTTIDCSMQFQGDLRGRDLVDWYDIDVAWSDTHRRTDSYGNVRGLGTIQRMKLWRDRYSNFHYFTFYANYRRRWKEYMVHDFDADFRQRDDRHRRLQLNVRGARRASASEGHGRDRRFSASSIFRPRNGGSSSHGGESTGELRYLGIQFTRNDRAEPGSDDYRRFIDLIILSVNAGSSSVKVSVYSAEYGQPPVQLAEAQISGLTAPPAILDYTRGSEKVIKADKMNDKTLSQRDAFGVLLKTLVDDADLPQISHKDDIGIVCHRIVHGGDYNKSQLISPDTYRVLEGLNDLAPLHNSNSLGIVQACIRDLSGSRNIACFDSQFHSTIPPHIRTYPINPDIAQSNKLRKYGFHGISYSFITRASAKFLGKSKDKLNLIALHLGSGASACAIKGGKSWDTSMGLTPLAGLPGATRSGSVDPSLVFHYASDVGRLSPASTKELHISRAEEILNKEAGWKALTGTTNFGIIATSNDPPMKLAFDLVVDRICGFIGSYYVSLRGEVDALVFAGGIGEKSDKLRRAVVDQISCLGFALDEDANAKKLEDVVQDISGAGAKQKVLVCATDEQFEMARVCAEDQDLWP
ncbi:Acetokinase family-domain-containing protein [Immersiella caudata]|uniref:Probable acetate kinase n=1 Tax=Immersiella caudata TaxID=314043 RepID=A0AA39XHU0_9PEZI|nr:Acetokinase family-domain-containing protein [Immersiella caudata]